MGQLIGFQRTAIADFGFPVSADGTAVVIYGYNIIPQVTGTSPDIIFQTADDSATTVLKCNTTADVASTVVFAEGITFPVGCWVDTSDANNVSAITVFYQKV
jgi:hypothetical protein